jgi:hypothetical protein
LWRVRLALSERLVLGDRPPCAKLLQSVDSRSYIQSVATFHANGPTTHGVPIIPSPRTVFADASDTAFWVLGSSPLLPLGPVGRSYRSPTVSQFDAYKWDWTGRELGRFQFHRVRRRLNLRISPALVMQTRTLEAVDPVSSACPPFSSGPAKRSYRSSTVSRYDTYKWD